MGTDKKIVVLVGGCGQSGLALKSALVGSCSKIIDTFPPMRHSSYKDGVPTTTRGGKSQRKRNRKNRWG